MSLNVLLFLGSARSAAPHWAKYKPFPARTADRVLAFVQSRVKALGGINLTVVDPLEHPSLIDLTINNGNPTYYHSSNVEDCGKEFVTLVSQVEAADAFLVVCPEYNHTIPPVLTAMMNHVGCSKYAKKVSGCVSYSGFSSAAGGARCAVALRPFLSELGCLPVSKQVVIPNAPAQITEEGAAAGDHASGIEKTMDGMLEQLKWWAQACKMQRAREE